MTSARIANTAAHIDQAYSPGGANVDTYLMHRSLGWPTRIAPMRHLDRFSLFAGHTVVINSRTDRPRNVKTCVGIARIEHCAQRCEKMKTERRKKKNKENVAN